MTFPTQNRLTAFLTALIFAVLYYAIFHVATRHLSPVQLWSIWAHFAFVWLPLILTALLYLWAIRRLRISVLSRTVATLCAAPLSTLLGAILFQLLWFHQLPVIR